MRRFVASMTAAASGAAAMLAMAGVGVAAPENPAPPSGDERAVSYSGNVVAADCPTLWPGSTAVEVDATITDETYITITEIPDGVEIVGVVVKGGDGYNVYEADSELLSPWVLLHAPLAGNSEGPAAISHWFVCGVTEQSTSTTTSTTPPTSSTSGTTTSSTTTSSTTESSSPTGEPSTSVTTTSMAAVPVVNDEDLASTGANVGWLVLLGGALLLAGGALLGFPHVRKALLRR